MEEWFSLVNEKNMLVREESDLVYELRDLELIEQHDQLEKEIRLRVSKDGECSVHLSATMYVMYKRLSLLFCRLFEE